MAMAHYLSLLLGLPQQDHMGVLGTTHKELAIDKEKQVLSTWGFGCTQVVYFQRFVDLLPTKVLKDTIRNTVL